MPKTYTAPEVEEIMRECLGEMEEEIKSNYNDFGTIRNALRSQVKERLEKRLSAKEK